MSLGQRFVLILNHLEIVSHLLIGEIRDGLIHAKTKVVIVYPHKVGIEGLVALGHEVVLHCLVSSVVGLLLKHLLLSLELHLLSFHLLLLKLHLLSH